MDNRDAGRIPPDAGVPLKEPPVPIARAKAPGRGGESAGSKTLKSAEQPKAEDRTPRKRRKRKRGRKAFVRGDVSVTANLAAPSPSSAVSASDAAAPPIPPAIHRETADRSSLMQAEPASRGERQALDTGAITSRQPPSRSPSIHAPSGRSRDLPVFAALDLGTNNCRLLAAVPSAPGQFRVVDAFSRIVRLGEGLSQTGELGAAAMDRAVDALKVCGDKLRARPIERARLIATEACRAAANGEAFVARVEREAGIRLEVIDRETEARLAVSGCGSLVEADARGVVLFDIGGGSTEIALVDLTEARGAQLADSITAWTSLPVGVVSLAETFNGRDVTRASFAAMVAHVAAMIDRFAERDRLDHLQGNPNLHLLGTSGTVTTLAGIHLELPRYDRRRVDGLWMDDASVDRMMEKLLGWDFAQRVANPCIGADRADLVLAGCAILQAIRAVWPTPRLRVADRGLREGMLSELMTEAGVWRRSRQGAYA